MNIQIDKNCTGCGLCESINNKIFNVKSGMAHVNSSQIEGNEADCWDAADQCPVGAINIID